MFYIIGILLMAIIWLIVLFIDPNCNKKFIYQNSNKVIGVTINITVMSILWPVTALGMSIYGFVDLITGEK